MNFKLLIILISILYISCGVKSPPTLPPNAAIPSYEEKFKRPIIRKLEDYKNENKNKNKKMKVEEN